MMQRVSDLIAKIDKIPRFNQEMRVDIESESLRIRSTWERDQGWEIHHASFPVTSDETGLFAISDTKQEVFKSLIDEVFIIGGCAVKSDTNAVDALHVVLTGKYGKALTEMALINILSEFWKLYNQTYDPKLELDVEIIRNLIQKDKE